MEDNFYQVSTEGLFPTSKETEDRQVKAKMAYEKEAPIIAETIERLKNQIKFCESVYSIKTEDDPDQFMREVAVNKRVAAILDKELKRLEGEVKKYSKKPQR